MHIEIYTDGSFPYPNDNRYHVADPIGGWAYVIKTANTQPLVQSGTLSTHNEQRATNNRCEMWGIIQGLLAIIQHRHFIKSDSIMLTVYSDSDYSVSMFSRKWSLKPKSKNRDLIEMSYGLVIQLNALGVTTDFRWVRGHADNQYNNMADEAANRMLKTTLIESTHSYTQGTL